MTFRNSKPSLLLQLFHRFYGGNGKNTIQSGGDLPSVQSVRSEIGVRLSRESTRPSRHVGWPHTVRVIQRMAFDCR
ncbi:hypothetical protein HC928_15210 [bacterium]|nr:hypothetical protein [bacterium]